MWGVPIKRRSRANAKGMVNTNRITTAFTRSFSVPSNGPHTRPATVTAAESAAFRSKNDAFPWEPASPFAR